jgi:hypothetical protein
VKNFYGSGSNLGSYVDYMAEILFDEDLRRGGMISFVEREFLQ